NAAARPRRPGDWRPRSRQGSRAARARSPPLRPWPEPAPAKIPRALDDGKEAGGPGHVCLPHGVSEVQAENHSRAEPAGGTTQGLNPVRGPQVVPGGVVAALGRPNAEGAAAGMAGSRAAYDGEAEPRAPGAQAPVGILEEQEV